MTPSNEAGLQFAGVDDGQNVEALYGHLRRLIIRGEIAPGDELSQVRLSKQFGVSRTPLREALRMLIHEGLVEGQPNRQLKVAGFSLEDMEQLYVERVVLEAIAVRVSVPKFTSLDIAEMEGLLAKMTHFAGEEDYESWEVPHRALHAWFVAHAGKRTVSLITQLTEHAERYRRLYTTQVARAWSIGLAEHREIIDACKRGDADASARALAGHLGHTVLGVIELVDPSYEAVALRTAIAAASTPVAGGYG